MDVIVLAGGRSQRMGADKAQVRLNGQRLIDIALANLHKALGTKLGKIVVVSPYDLELHDDTVILTSEEPAFGGPVAGINAGVAHTDSIEVGIISVDAPRASFELPRLSAALNDHSVAVIQGEEFLQPLCAVWKRRELIRALETLTPAGASAKALIRAARSSVLVPGTGAETDYDTRSELEKLGEVTLPR